MRGGELLDRVKRLTGDHSWSDFTEINNAYRELLVRAGAEVVKVRDETSVAFKSDVKRYTLPSERIRRLESIWVKATDGQREWRQMTQFSDDDFEAEVLRNKTTTGADDTDTPSVYRLHGGIVEQLEINPVASGDFPVRLLYLGEPEELERGSVPILPVSYHWMIANLAAAEVLEYSEEQVKQAKASGLRRLVARQYERLAHDMTPNRAGVNFPVRRIIRA